MYSTCLFCARNLGANAVIETLPVGRRLAFDAAQGRLWVVCKECGKWNLVPFDTRLESIDACERLFRDTPTRFSTDNIGIARLKEGLELVRVGPALRPEFASWRYGAQYRRRRNMTLVAATAGGALGIAAWAGIAAVAGAQGVVLSGFAGAGGQALSRFGWNFVRNRRRRIITQLEGEERTRVLSAGKIESSRLLFLPGSLGLQFGNAFGGYVIVTADAAPLLMRQVTASLNDTVGSKRDLDAAIGRLTTGGLHDWLRTTAEKTPVTIENPDGPVRRRERGRWVHADEVPAIGLKALKPSDRLALEMWLSEEDEARALAGELALLERQWKEAERLAKIADDLVITPD